MSVSESPPERATSERTGYAKVSVTVFQNPKISPQARCLYGLLCTYVNNRTRITHVGRRRLAEDIGCTERTVGNLLGELREAGVLDRSYRGYAMNRGTRLLDFVWVLKDVS